MRSQSLAHVLATLMAGCVFVAANTAPVVCAAVHHSQHAAVQAAGHHDHGQAPAPLAGGPAVDGSHTTPPGCADMGHCGVAVNGITTVVAVFQAAAPHPATEPGTAGTRPHTASFSPPTPPPRL